MKIIVNDGERTVPAGCTVAMLLDLLGLKPRFLAVELNRQVVPHNQYPQTLLADGDRVEIVTLVGGG